MYIVYHKLQLKSTPCKKRKRGNCKHFIMKTNGSLRSWRCCPRIVQNCHAARVPKINMRMPVDRHIDKADPRRPSQRFFSAEFKPPQIPKELSKILRRQNGDSIRVKSPEPFSQLGAFRKGDDGRSPSSFGHIYVLLIGLFFTASLRRSIPNVP